MADYTVPTDSSVAGVTAGAGTIAGVANTFMLPNFVGELFSLVPTQTPFLSMAGGLTGGKAVPAKEFGWQVIGNEAAETNATSAKAEGAAPTPSVNVRQEVKNVVEIHQESVNLSYTKQAAWGQLGIGGDGVGAGVTVNILGDQPVKNEMATQLELKISKIARDVELSFLKGEYDAGDAIAATNERQTRGITTAATTHSAAFATDLRTSINAMLAGMYESEDTVAPLVQPVLFMNGSTKVKTSLEYTNNLGLADRSRTIGGVNVETLITDFGSFGIVLDRYMDADAILLADMSVVAPCFLPIPGKGHFFAEPLAKTGAYDHVQLYGEIGLEYGPEQYHGQITSIT